MDPTSEIEGREGLVYVKGQNGGAGREGLRIPENYGGNAFRRIERSFSEEVSQPREDVFQGLPYGADAMPPMPMEDDLSPESVEEEQGEAVEVEEAEKIEEIPKPAAEVAARSAWSFRDVGSEELLLIGLLLILLRDGVGDDTLWILGLLLFWQ